MKFSIYFLRKYEIRKRFQIMTNMRAKINIFNVYPFRYNKYFVLTFLVIKNIKLIFYLILGVKRSTLCSLNIKMFLSSLYITRREFSFPKVKFLGFLSHPCANYGIQYHSTPPTLFNEPRFTQFST